MRKRILMISPMPSHPPNAGSNIRILRVASALRDMGHEVHFLLAEGAEQGDGPAMRAFWGDLLHRVPVRYPRRNLARLCITGMRQLFGVHLYALDDWYYTIDDWYDRALDPHIAALSQAIKPHVVLVEYVFLSRALLQFGDSVLKIISTHDAFTHRHREFQRLSKNGRYKWWTATPAGEALGLSRADVVIAVQEQEAAHFRRLGAKKVLTVGHLSPPGLSDDQPSEGYDLLFVGTNTVENRLGVEFFTADVLPSVRGRYPDARLLLVGKVCNVVGDLPGCIRLGALDDLGNAYRRAAVAINPAYTGTGVAIKSIEALSFGKPLVTTPRGARGLEDGAGSAFCVAKDAADFGEQIIRLFQDGGRRQALAAKASEFAQHYYQISLERLATAIEAEPGCPRRLEVEP